MKIYLDGQALSVAIPLSDEGVCIVASAVEYRIVDHAGTELVAKTPVSGFIAGDPQVIVSITAQVNTIAASAKRELRVVELYLTTEAGTVKLTHEYVLESENILEKAVNSFQGYHEAVLLSLDIANLPSFNDALKADRITALINAWSNIGKLYLRYVDDSEMTRVIVPWTESGNVTRLTAEQFDLLPEAMKLAIRRAQVMEADYLLGKSASLEELRTSGVVSNTVGESSQWFIQAKPYEGILGKRASRELARFIVKRTAIGRGS